MVNQSELRAYLASPCVVHDLRDGSCLVHDIGRDRIQRVSRETARCLATLQGGRSGVAQTMAERVRVIVDLLRGTSGARRWFGRSTSADGAADTATIDELFEHDWIVTERRLLDLIAGAQAGTGGQVACLTIVTMDRAPLLRRCLRSVLENRRCWGRRYRLAVFDDSIDRAHRDATRAAVAELSAEYGAPIAHVDHECKRRLIRDLGARTGIDDHILAFGLLGGPGNGANGANLNNVLLHVAGELAISVDDDVICRMGPPPEARLDALCFSQDADPTVMQFCGARQDALGAVRDGCADVAAIHERVLGNSLGDLVAQYATARMSSTPSARLTKSALLLKGTVVATSTGMAGDGGLGTAHDLLLLKSHCLDQLAALMPRGGDRVARDIVRAARETTITAGGSFMSMSIGLDHRALLPPFMPGYRNCDGLFSVSVPLCLPHGYFAHLPFLIAHDPADERRWSREDLWRRAGAVRFNDLMCGVLQTARHGLGTSDDSQERMQSLGLYCEMLGKQPYQAFKDVVRSLWVGRQHERLDRLLTHLDRGALDLRMADAIRRQIVTITEALNQRAVTLSDVHAPGGTSDGAIRRMQDDVRKYGELLGAWPAIRRESRHVAVQEPSAFSA
jgi:hypothetical protein